ncbi:unnamed protein product [Gongylonema pulchrum]|uniref:DUF1722 domain-containing protein n=1 Tax=Gongylonema pulchrum TaxID=637853 RepID=A0A183D674_9BILA|nr:unnamed protein product [Gongylonema pulchrum]
MLIDLRSNQLPWGKALREERILYLKETTSDKDLLIDGKMEFFEKILKHLRKLHYADRPDYRAIYRTVQKSPHKTSFASLFQFLKSEIRQDGNPKF